MDAEIIAVGSELLLGQIANTNAQYLSKQLAELGVNVYYHTVVGDNAERLAQAIEVAEGRAELILFTGGLGPTKDDLTKETISRHLRADLIFDLEALQSIQLYFKRTGREMTENNKKQALVLEKSTILPNDHGMAPGMLYTSQSHAYMLLPGPPKEMQPMFAVYGVQALQKILKHNDKIQSRVLRFYGIGEALLETKIEDLLVKQSNPTIAPLASDGEVTLRITAKHLSSTEGAKMIQSVQDEILNRVGEYYYGMDETSLIEEAVKELKRRHFTVTSAESLTGGMFQQMLTSVPGASKVFKGGLVSYSNEVKAQVLGVSQSTIITEGVVSERCAIEMAEGAKTLFNSDYAVSFTGVAGPDDLEGHPVGTVFIGLAAPGKDTQAFPLQLGQSSREQIRLRSVKKGCSLLLAALRD
ncbi:competence/damage-inducible protein A [Bacillus testis]|uniref:competence/damage-inducible protein A n=1 Tax=Bacillus testis TaxID=1622072 RepID=UPI00067E8AD9|nr:competence/damage-inducible protein A [Bacillus testis]